MSYQARSSISDAIADQVMNISRFEDMSLCFRQQSLLRYQYRNTLEIG